MSLPRDREQSVCVQASMDSILEKKSSGVLRSKSKVKCWLHGSTLYEQKDQEMKMRDMRQAETVRKVANDITGTQFEIVIKKKTHNYTCSSSDECKAWVTTLQKCMMLKDCGDTNSQSMFYMAEDTSIYSSIDESSQDPPSTPSQLTESNEKMESIYSTPHDSVEQTPVNHNEYEDVVMRPSSYLETIKNGQKTASHQEQTDVDYTDAVSLPSTSQNDPIDALAVFSAALDDDEAPLEDLPHSLKSEDIACLRDLKAYLKENKSYWSHTSIRSSEDPLTALKKCLASLNVC